MLITRWMAPVRPTIPQIKLLLEAEGLEPFEEQYQPQEKIAEHRHPFAEVRVVAQGEFLFSIAGNQFLLREGDRVEIPANTKHWHSNHGSGPAICICAQRVF